MDAPDKTTTTGAKTRRTGMRRALATLRSLFRPHRYRPERHYMRGPGPASRRASAKLAKSEGDPGGR